MGPGSHRRRAGPGSVPQAQRRGRRRDTCGRTVAGLDPHLFLEYCYKGDGESSPDRYSERLLDPDFLTDPYLGRHYTVIAGQYEIHPLLNADASVMINLNDESLMMSGSLRYSVSDEADFTAGFMLPAGKEIATIRVNDAYDSPDIRSEYGSYPKSFFVEFRFFF